MTHACIQGAESPNSETQGSLLVVTEETSLGKGRTRRPIREGASFRPLSMHSLIVLTHCSPPTSLERSPCLDVLGVLHGSVTVFFWGLE